MTYYFFEDRKYDALSFLFRTAYSVPNFYYSSGNSELYTKITEVCKNKNEEIIIVMDLVFDNSNTATVYGRLVRDLRLAGYTNFIVFPMVCSEYYAIKLLNHLGLLQNSPLIKLCLDKGDYRNTYIADPYIARSTSFEKFCKRILYVLAPLCANNTRYNDNLQFRDFYIKNCVCQNPMPGCSFSRSRLDKAFGFLQQYPCVPTGALRQLGTPLSREEMIEKHKQLVTEYNAEMDRHKKLETNPHRRGLYQRIVPMFP